MPPRKRPVEGDHVAPPEVPFQAAPEVPDVTPSVKESCSNCLGAVPKGGLLYCHGRAPSAVYRQVVIGVGATGDAMWPKVNPDDWCMDWMEKRS